MKSQLDVVHVNYRNSRAEPRRSTARMRRAKRRLHRAAWGAGVIGTAALLAGCVTPAAEAPPTSASDEANSSWLDTFDPITLRASLPIPSTSTGGTLLTTWAKEVEERTDGKVTIETYFDGTLVPPAESLAGVQSGLTDIGFVGASNQPSELPVANWLLHLATPMTAPLGYPMADLAGYPATAGIFTSAAPVVEELAANNLVPLLHFYSSPFHLVCDEPMTTPEDVAGKTVRTGGLPWTEEVAALDMTNVFLPVTEMYEALQRGVIDCGLIAADTILYSGVTEVAGAVMLIDSGISAGVQIVFNKDSWDSLPAELQQVMREAAGPAHAEYMRHTFEIYRDHITVAQDAGLEFPSVDAINEVLRHHRAGLLEELLANPPAGITDPEAIRDQYEAYIDEWVAWVESELDRDTTDPATASVEQLIAAYTAGDEGIDWTAYEREFETFFAQFD